MRIPLLSYIAAAGATLLLSGNAMGQALPKNVVPENGRKYCEDTVTGLNGKDVPAIIHAYRDASNPSLSMIEFGEPSYRFPGDPEKTWPYTALNFFRFVVNGDALGDDTTDFVYFSKDGKVVGWNPKQNKSDIGPGEIASFNSVVAALQKCK